MGFDLWAVAYFAAGAAVVGLRRGMYGESPDDFEVFLFWLCFFLWPLALAFILGLVTGGAWRLRATRRVKTSNDC